MTERVESLFHDLKQGDIRALSQAITLVESTLSTDVKDADQLIELCSPLAGGAHRIAITGVPGVGKSTFIESLGMRICEAGSRVAVLAIDPTSTRTGGSILGDKTRMERLSNHSHSFIRPSASSATLGGVARKTRESIVLCEAAGFDVVFVETVGVGQSETKVRSMVDTFILLMLMGAGDELQGIKRGIMEMADLILVNKVEEEGQKKAREAISDYRSALHLLGDTATGWSPLVDSVSSLTGRGMDKVEVTIKEHWQHLAQHDRLRIQRASQDIEWFEQALHEELYRNFISSSEALKRIEEFKEKVRRGETSPLVAARKVLGV